MLRANRRPERLEEISDWLRRGQISPTDAIRLAVELRRRQPTTKGAPPAPSADPDPVQPILAELDQLVGMAAVKRHVKEIQAFAAVGARRANVGLKNPVQGLHMIFTGNPGTGKTTVARLLGRLFAAMGLLSTGHFVEVERADLVGEYIGHTAARTREVVKRAVGGVLFLDEAYSLARGGEKDFGREAIDCLVRGMEEYRGQLILILAGYPAEMAWFMAQNPGLRSRFPIQIAFPDYTPTELLAIAELMWAEREYWLAPSAREHLGALIERGGLRASGEHGNARAIRNLVERSLRTQALRLVGQPQATREELMSILRSDLENALRAGNLSS
jgi:stage V sporulation protein K